MKYELFGNDLISFPAYFKLFNLMRGCILMLCVGCANFLFV